MRTQKQHPTSPIQPRAAAGIIACAAAIALVSVGCAGVEPISTDEPAATPETAKVRFSFVAGAPPSNLSPTENVPETVYIKNATIFTSAGPRIESGHVIMQGGVIKAIGAEALQPPKGALVIDAADRYITPGVIDTHSHLGVYPTPYVAAHRDGNEATAPATPDVRAEHSVWPQDPGFQRAVEGGVTTLQILPGSANLVGGRGVTLKNHPSISSRAMRFPDAPWGLKMACGENPKRVYGERKAKPSTRMGNMATWRATFQRAAEYRTGRATFKEAFVRWRANKEPVSEKGPAPPEPPRDLGMETLVAAMEGDILVHVHCYRADEMIQVLELADEFGFAVRSFHHAVESYKIRDVLAAYDVGVSTWADWWGFKIEAHDAIMENAGMLHTAGVKAIIHSDDALGIQRLNQEAAKAYFRAKDAGIDVTEEDAIAWITINPAWALGVEERTGSLEEGKMADLVIWDAHPLSVYARPDVVFVDGVREYDAARTDDPWSDFEVDQLPRTTKSPAGAVPRAPRRTKGGTP